MFLTNYVTKIDLVKHYWNTQTLCLLIKQSFLNNIFINPHETIVSFCSGSFLSTLWPDPVRSVPPSDFWISHCVPSLIYFTGLSVRGFSQRAQCSESGLPDRQPPDPDGTQNGGDGGDGGDGALSGENNHWWKDSRDFMKQLVTRVSCVRFSSNDCKNTVKEEERTSSETFGF